MTPTPAEAKAVLNTPTLIMGPSKSGKSSLLATFAEYVWETYRKVTHLVLIDGGGFPMQMQALINVGVVRFWRARTRTGQGLAYETCQRAAQGWWPKSINPKTGQTEPDVKLVPPVQTVYTVSCPNGHTLKKVPFRSLASGGLCPTCKTMVNDQNKVITVETRQTPGFEQVGALMIEGLSSGCSWMMDDLQERAGRNELGGEKGALGTIVSGDIAVGSSNRAMYGNVQTRANALVNHSAGVPNLVIPPIWTALTAEGSDEGGLTIVGPQIAGQARTAEAPQWFGDCMETAIVEREGKRYRRLYLQPYVDANGRNHLCGVRSYPGQLPPFFEDEEGQAVFDKFSLKYFYQQRDLALAATLADYATRYPDAPGVPEGLATVGGEEPAEEKPAVNQPAARPVPPRPTPAPKVAAPAAAPRPTPAAAPQAPQVPPPAEAPVSPAPPEDPPGAPTSGSTPVTPGVEQPAARPAPVPAPALVAAKPIVATPPPRPRAGAPRPPAAAPLQSPMPATTPRPGGPPAAAPGASAAAAGPSPAATGPVARPLAPPAPPAKGPQAPAPPPGRRPAASGTPQP